MTKKVKSVTGELIRDLRRGRKLSQQALADYSGVNRSYISRLERGLANPTELVIFKLSEFLHIRPSRLFILIEDRVMTVHEYSWLTRY